MNSSSSNQWLWLGQLVAIAGGGKMGRGEEGGKMATRDEEMKKWKAEIMSRGIVDWTKGCIGGRK